jgi:cellulose synthase/poly-beta-1,6-N-acetylglucosamine synthase-like glycosyltransferase
VYDAEDRPDPNQLLKVAATFAQLGERTGCVQAELAYYNVSENVITRWFAVEYRMWFTQFLPALSRCNAAIPLGGTSNHMRRDLLIKLGAWDPYNVTEDADLGIRLRRCGYTVAVLDSLTHEEANTDFVNWVKQRSRWYKGYMQTWLVHMRHPRRLLKDLGFGAFVRFNLFVGGTPILAMLNPISWALIIVWFVLQPQFIVDIMPAPVYYTGLFGWLFGNFMFYYLNLMAAYEFDDKKIFMTALWLPGYWVMMSIAAVKAMLQLVFMPAYWEKTEHGLSNVAREPEPEADVMLSAESGFA